MNRMTKFGIFCHFEQYRIIPFGVLGINDPCPKDHTVVSRIA
jgi:hypothetical protein